MNKNKAVALIALALDIEEANRIIEDELGIIEIDLKIRFLTENFDCVMIGHLPESESDYVCMLNAIIKNKYR